MQKLQESFQRLLRRMMRFSIPNLMTYVVGGMAICFVLNMFGLNVYAWFGLSRSAIFRGEIWRLVTFIFLPNTSSIISLVFSLYFYYLIGNALQGQWGTSRFTAFYLFGVIGTIIACLITGSASNTYLNLSLFLAFAAVYPNYQILLFFFIPIKVKYLGIADLIYLVYLLIIGTWPMRAAILFSLLNIILFMGGDMINTLRDESKYWKTRRNFKRTMRR